MSIDAMGRSLSQGRCPYMDGPHEFVTYWGHLSEHCRLCSMTRETLLKVSINGLILELWDGVPEWSGGNERPAPNGKP